MEEAAQMSPLAQTLIAAAIVLFSMFYFERRKKREADKKNGIQPKKKNPFR